jgi:hypothetical protein
MREKDESPPVLQQVPNNETSTHQFVKFVKTAPFENTKRLSNYEAVPETHFYVLNDTYFNLQKTKDVHQQESENQEIHQTDTNDRMPNIVCDDIIPNPADSVPEIYIEISRPDQDMRITDIAYNHPPPNNRLNEEISVYPDNDRIPIIRIKEESTYQPLKTRTSWG